MMASSSGRPALTDVVERYFTSGAGAGEAILTTSGSYLEHASSLIGGADHLRNGSKASPHQLGPAPAFYSDFAKFLQQQRHKPCLLSPTSQSALVQKPWRINSSLLTKHCTVNLVNLDLKGTRAASPKSMESTSSPASSSLIKEMAAANKRDIEPPIDGGPSQKKSKTDEVIVIENTDRLESEKARPSPASPEITVIKLNSKSGLKETNGGPVGVDRKNDAKSPVEKRSSRTTTPDKVSSLKPVFADPGKKQLMSFHQSESTASKVSSKNGGSSSLSGGAPGPGPGGSLTVQNTVDRTDRTSLQCLEQKLKDLQQKHQQKAKSSDGHSKPKSMSPSSGLKSSKDAFHRRSEAFILERKKQLSSPVKKTIKKPSLTPPPHRENKLGGLFCPTTDAKVTILPCKPSAREPEVKPLPSSSNSVTITKLSSGDTLSVPPKDIKKVFSKTDLKNKVISAMAVKSEKASLKSGGIKAEKLGGEKLSHKEYRQHGANSREASRDGREKGGSERRERVGSLKIIRCSKCREVFSTKEAKKLHTCNSILDAHYLIDGGDRQKTSPTSSLSNSDRSESTSASLSRSSSRSSSPGIPLSSAGAKRPQHFGTPVMDGSARLKLAKKLEEDRELGRMKSAGDEEDVKEKWTGGDVGDVHDKLNNKNDPFKKQRAAGSLIIEAVKATGPEGDGQRPVKCSSIDIVKMERDSRKESKDDLSSDAALFAFSGKRTYSPSMSDNTTEGKESPRETNSKDSPASQADSGVFSIASSASPSKTDTVLNSDVRSPDSPSRSLDHSLHSKQEQNQWKLGTTSGDSKLYSSSLKTNSGTLSGKIDGDPPLPQGINLPSNTSITRVVPAHLTSSPSPYSSSNSMGQQQPGSKGLPGMGMGMGIGSAWPPPLMLPNYMSAQMMDDLSRKKRGRPRKNGDPIFSSTKSRSSKPKAMEDDKDMYDFEMEEDESKPVQPLRPRRQNAQPVTYKDPDSDEDAKARQPQMPLIQATQGYREVHHKTQGVISAEASIMEESGDHGGSLEDISLEDTELEDSEKDKNISYTCSKIEETPKGGIKLKIKIKKSASPAPLDPEPPLKKTKLGLPEDNDSSADIFPKEEAPASATSDTAEETSNIEEIHRLASSLEPTAGSIAPGAPSEESQPSPLKSPPLKSPHPHIVSPAHAQISAGNKIMPGLAGGMQPQNNTNQSHFSPLGASPGRSPAAATGSFTPNSNQVPMHSPVSNNSASSSMEDIMKNNVPASVQNPYAIQKQNFPNSANNTHVPTKNNFDMPQQGYPGSNVGDFFNYNMPYGGNNYVDQQQSQMYGGGLPQQPQQGPYQPHHLQHHQQQQHMAAFRPGIRPQQRSLPQQQSPFMQGRMMDHRYNPHHAQMDMDMHVGIGGPHMGGMGMGVPPHLNPAMVGRHPGMISPMMSMGGYQGHGMVAPMPNISPKHMSLSMGPGGNLMNSSVMSPMSGHGGGMHTSGMSPQSAMAMADRQVVGPPAMSPQSMPMSDRLPLFPGSQFRMASPQYGQSGPGQPTSFSHSPTYPGTQAYQRPPTPQGYKPPTPQNYQRSPTPHSHPKPPTPQSSQNPTTPGSYHNPSTPGSSYPNPTTPLSLQNPLTPQSYDPPTPQQPPHGHQLNASFESPASTGGGGGGVSSLPQPVIQPNPLAASGAAAAAAVTPAPFIVPKTESVIHSPVHNIFSKDSSKISTPMLSPPSTTSSLRKIRRPSKSVTPGTVSPGQKSLSPNYVKDMVKLESDIIVPKKESPSSPQAAAADGATASSLAEESVVTVKSEPCDPSSPSPPESSDNSSQPSQPSAESSVKQEVQPPRTPTPKSETSPPSPPKAKTPEPPKEPRWGDDGVDGMPRRALRRIFAYVCYTEGCLPFLPNAMLVCKLWNEVAVDPTLWTHANLGTAIKEKVRSEKKLEWILKNKFPHAIDVDVTGWKAVMSAPALKIIAANCPKLSGLGLSNCVKLNFEDIRIVPSLFPNLERIDLSLVSPSTASSRSAVSSTALSDLITSLGEKLTHFNMSSNKMAGLPFVFKALSSHAKNLRFLDVSNISTTSRDTILINIEKLAKGCPKLTTFRTTNTMLGLNEAPVREQVMSPGFPLLEELTIGVDQRGYFDGMDDGQIERILKKSNRLKLLDIRGCKGISDSTLVRLPCWDLEYLYVAGCSVTSSSRDGLELLVKKWSSTLIELDIGLTADARTVDWAVMALVENEGNLKLRKLNLTGTGVNLKPLTKLLNCCPTLSSLNLTSCRALPRGMKRMYHNREDVEALRQGIIDGKFNDNGSEEDD